MTTTLESIRAMNPPIIIIVVGMLILLLDVGRSTAQQRRILPWGSILGLLLAALGAVSMLGITTLAGDIEPAASYFGGGMVGDRFGGMFCIVLCIVAAFAILMSGRYLEEKAINQGEYFALILFSTAGAMLMALSSDLVNVFVGLEVLSVSLYILAGFARRERRSEEAAVKYFLLGSFATGFLLFGTALIYGSVGLTLQAMGVRDVGPSYTNFNAIAQALTASAATGTPLLTSPVFVAGVGLLIVGLGFKAAIVPFHSYAPDVYEGAPTPVTAFMSVAAKVGAFAALTRFLQVLSSVAGGGPFHAVLWGLAVATMVVGNVLAVRQSNIKRMLAYSSIAHAGYILVGVLAGMHSRSTGLAQEALQYYLFAYAFMNLGAFAVVIWLGHHGGEYLEIKDYAGLGRKHPLAAAVMTVFMLSLAGIPLTAGFLGKLYLFMAAIQAGETVLAAIGLVVSAIGVFYYLNIVAMMFFRAPTHEFDAPRAGGAKIAALLCALATFVYGLYPVGVTPEVGTEGMSMRAPDRPDSSTAAPPPRSEPTPSVMPEPGPPPPP